MREFVYKGTRQARSNAPAPPLRGAKRAATVRARMTMNWPQLFCADRLGREAKSRPRDATPRSEYRRDGDRLTFSTAFRRLQDKTQVFPLADNDYVRTRVTHSLEVASVGRESARQYVSGIGFPISIA